MFRELEQFLEKADLNLVISKQGERIVISTLPKLKGEDQPELKPLIISGTAAEMDEGFIQAIETKLAPIQGLQIEAEAFETSLTEAKEDINGSSKKSSKGKTAAKKEEPKKEEKVKAIPIAEQVKTLLDEGNKAFTSKDYQLAIEKFTALLVLRPDDKKGKELLLASQRWKKSVDDMNSNSETKTEEVDKNQIDLTKQPGVTEEKTEEPVHEGPGESEDNAAEEEFNF